MTKIFTGHLKGNIVIDHATIRWKRIFTFYGVLFTVSYGMVGTFLLTGGSFADPSWALYAQVSALSPALVALFLSKWLWKEPVVQHLNLKPVFNRWLLVAWLLAPVSTLMSLGLGLAMPGTHLDVTLQPAVDGALISPEQAAMFRSLAQSLGTSPVLLLIPTGILLSLTMSLVAGCGEEFGWRGLVHSELRPLGFWRNVFITGILWLTWHLPLLAFGYGFPDHPGLGILLMSAQIMISSIILGYIRERSSTFAAGLFHGANEAFILLAVAPVANGNELTVGVASLSWISADLIVCAALLLYDRFISETPIAWPPANHA